MQVSHVSQGEGFSLSTKMACRGPKLCNLHLRFEHVSTQLAVGGSANRCRHVDPLGPP